MNHNKMIEIFSAKEEKLVSQEHHYHIKRLTILEKYV